MNKILKLILHKTLVPKLRKLVKASTNNFDDKFLELVIELIDTYL